jgi:type II secretory pathway pseudopilin PulG
MKTKNIILLGVVGVGAVGAYMYMKNKQAQDAMLQQQAIDMAKLQNGSTTTASDSAVISATTTDGISPTQRALDLENAQRIVSDIEWLLPRANNYIGKKFMTELTQKNADLEKLGYRYDPKTYMLTEGKFVEGVDTLTKKPTSVWQSSNAVNPMLDLVNAKKILSAIEWEKVNGGLPFTKAEKIKRYTAQLSKIGYKIDAKNQLVKI